MSYCRKCIHESKGTVAAYIFLSSPIDFCIAQGHCLDMNASPSLFLVSVLQAITQMDPPWTA